MSLPITEQENLNTVNIDKLPTLEAIRLINDEDKKVATAIEKALPQIASAIDKISERLKKSGKLFYVGTGTSGRLGVLDASEIPPTFGVSPNLIQGVIAGGFKALYKATEASEDNKDAGKKDLIALGITNNDAVIGIAASGRTPYTIGAVEYARSIDCFTACITCVSDSEITKVVDTPIIAVVGAEAITGSTRMKAGTAQKMILNMISTTVMIKLGYVKGNRMTNLKPKNKKLVERSIRILMNELNLNNESAKTLFHSAKNNLKIALVMGQTNASLDEASDALLEANDVIETAISKIKATT